MLSSDIISREIRSQQLLSYYGDGYDAEEPLEPSSSAEVVDQLQSLNDAPVNEAAIPSKLALSKEEVGQEQEGIG